MTTTARPSTRRHAKSDHDKLKKDCKNQKELKVIMNVTNLLVEVDEGIASNQLVEVEVVDQPAQEVILDAVPVPEIHRAGAKTSDDQY